MVVPPASKRSNVKDEIYKLRRRTFLRDDGAGWLILAVLCPSVEGSSLNNESQ